MSDPCAVRAGDRRVDAARVASAPVPAQRELFVARHRVVAQQRRDDARLTSRRSSPSTSSACASLNEMRSCFDVPAGVGEKCGVSLNELHRRRRVLEALRQEERDEARDARAARTRRAPADRCPSRLHPSSAAVALVNRPRPISRSPRRPARSARPCPSAGRGAASPARARRRERCCRGCTPCRSASAATPAARCSGASKISRSGSTAWAISSIRPVRTSPSAR